MKCRPEEGMFVIFYLKNNKHSILYLCLPKPSTGLVHMLMKDNSDCLVFNNYGTMSRKLGFFFNYAFIFLVTSLKFLYTLGYPSWMYNQKGLTLSVETFLDAQVKCFIGAK